MLLKHQVIIGLTYPKIEKLVELRIILTIGEAHERSLKVKSKLSFTS